MQAHVRLVMAQPLQEFLRRLLHHLPCSLQLPPCSMLRTAQQYHQWHGFSSYTNCLNPETAQNHRNVSSTLCPVQEIPGSTSIMSRVYSFDDSMALIRVEATCTALSTSASVQLSQPWKNGKDTATALQPKMAPSNAAPTVPDDSTEPLQSALLQYMGLQLGRPRYISGICQDSSVS